MKMRNTTPRLISTQILMLLIFITIGGCEKEQIKPDNAVGIQFLNNIKAFVVKGNFTRKELQSEFFLQANRLGGRMHTNNIDRSNGRVQCETHITYVDFSDGTCASFYDHCDGALDIYLWNKPCNDGSGTLIGRISLGAPEFPQNPPGN